MGAPEITVLRSLLRYNAETGLLYWLPRGQQMFTSSRHGLTWNTRYAGAEAFTSIDAHGYRQGQIFNHRFLAHRVVWAMHREDWNFRDLDHINGDRADNRIANLREATRAQNNVNAKPRTRASSTFLGVSWDSHADKWAANIGVDGRKRHLGRFDNEADAARAYDAAALKYYGSFANPNFPAASADWECPK